MFVASYRRTMASARPIAPEKPRRQKLIETARRWERLRLAEKARKQAAEDWRIRLILATRVDEPRKWTSVEIADYVAWWHGLSVDDLRARRNQKAWAPARFDAIAAIRIALPDLSLGQISKVLLRDQASVKNALRQRGLA